VSNGVHAPSGCFCKPELLVFSLHSGALSTKRLHRLGVRRVIQWSPPGKDNHVRKRTRLTKIWQISVGPSVRFPTLTSDFLIIGMFCAARSSLQAALVPLEVIEVLVLIARTAKLASLRLCCHAIRGGAIDHDVA
jgi:hypothetical protein